MENPATLENPKTALTPSITYVAENYRDTKILNDYDIGGQIIYQTKGTLPVFIDGRAGTAYNEKTIIDYLTFMNLDKDWPKVIAPYNIQVIFVTNHSAFAKMYKNGVFHNDWLETYNDGVASVYVRKE